LSPRPARTVLQYEREPGPCLSAIEIFPASGALAVTADFDLAVIVNAPACDVMITNGSANLDGFDITPLLLPCLRTGIITTGGETLRCPGFGSMLTPGMHTLRVSLDLSDGTLVTDSASWHVLQNIEH